jgi:hypothetical protein
MQHLATAQGFDYLAVFQPLLAFKTNLSDREKEIPTSETRDAILRKRDLFLNLIGSPKWMIHLADCSNIFKDSGEEVFVDQIHVNAAGQKMAMQCIREKLEQHLNTKHASHALQSPITIPEHIFIIGQTDFKKWLQEFANINF